MELLFGVRIGLGFSFLIAVGFEVFDQNSTRISITKMSQLRPDQIPRIIAESESFSLAEVFLR